MHSLPFINLMKNSASEIYAADHSTAYQHAFKYIRQLAILLRQSIKVQTKVREQALSPGSVMAYPQPHRIHTNRFTTGNTSIALIFGALC